MQISSSGGQVADPGMSFYNASKFGLEGFHESVAMELAPFGIEVTLVEPGGSRTNFNHALVRATPIDAYRDGIVGQVRGMLDADLDPAFVRNAVRGDPAKVAQAIIDSACSRTPLNSASSTSPAPGSSPAAPAGRKYAMLASTATVFSSSLVWTP